MTLHYSLGDGGGAIGGNYGGGAGGGSGAIVPANGGTGSVGAVRIIWGSGRSYPSTSVADATVVNYALTLSDLSGNGNNGTLINGVGFDGSNGGGLVFDGSNDYVDLNTNNITYQGGQNWPSFSVKLKNFKGEHSLVQPGQNF